jgi:uncharacterized membrane protein
MRTIVVRRVTMKRVMIASATVTALALGLVLPVSAADDSKVKAATGQVESGAKRIGRGQIGEGVEETAKGIGNTVVEGAKFTGEKLKESGQAAAPPARSAWDNVREGAVNAGHSVKNFFSRLFSN